MFDAAEINSSFHRPHRESTYARWADSVPRGFRFSVKLARTITHDARLARVGPLLDEFLRPVRALGDKFGCLLVQLPPKLELDPPLARRFFAALEARGVPAVALEPRHPSWFTPEADAFLAKHRVARVAADPKRAEGGDRPGGDRRFGYWRLHGSPRTYYSAYDDAFIARLADAIRREDHGGWCIFDNTAGNAAVPNALSLRERLESAEEAQAATLRPRPPRGAGQSSSAGR